MHRFEVKFSVPSAPPGAVERARLSTLLEGARSAPLTMVRGPAGSGKTEVVAGWARRTPAPLAWVSLDDRDRDPNHLVASLGAALAPIGSGGGRDDPDAAEEALAGLLGAVGHGADIVLVLDALEEVSGGRADALLDDLVRYAPPPLHLVVTTRRPPPFSLHRLRLGQGLIEIDGDDLRLDPDEAAALLAARPGLALSASQVVALHDATEGHLALTLAAAHALAPDGSGGPSAGGRPGRGLREAFAPLLDELHPDLRRFVLETAPLHHLSPSLCDAVTGRHDSATRLAELENTSLFLVRLTDQGPEYRYHRLVRQVLLDQLTDDDPARVVGAHRAAAHWMESHGDLIGAVDQNLAAGDDERAWALITGHHLEVFFDGHTDVIEDWATRLVPQLARTDPWDAVHRAMLDLMTGQADEAGRWIDSASRAITSTDRPEELRAVSTFVRAQCHFQWGELEDALVADEAVSLEHATTPYSALTATITRIEALAHLGRFDEAHRAFAAMAPSAAFEGRLAGVLVPGVQASLAACEGRLGDALALADDALAHARVLSDQDAIGTEDSHWAKGVALLEQGQVADAVPHLTTAQRLARRRGLAHLVVRSGIALARARRLQGRSADAFRLLELARRPLHVRPVSPTLLRWIDRAEARLLILTGDPDAAADLLAGHDGDDDPELVVPRAWVALRGNNRALAQDLLASAPAIDAAIGLRIEAELLRASCIRDPARVQRHLRRAVHLGAPDGYLTVFVNHRADIVDGLRDLRSVEPSAYLTDLLLLLEAGTNDALTEPLTERELTVVAALRSSRSTDEIAADLGVSLNTLKTHIKAVYRKLDAGTRTDAVRRAVMLRLIGPEAERGDADLSGPGAGR